VWGHFKLRALEEAWRAAVAAERARVAALRLPALFGEPLDGNAVDRYRPVLRSIDEAMKSHPQGQTLYSAETDQALEAGWAAELEPPVAALLEERQAEIEALAEAVRCTRVDWGTAWEEGHEAELPSLLAARVLANIATLSGNVRAAEGDVAGAFERHLSVVRFGVDLGSEGFLIQSLIGVAVRMIGLEAAGRLVTSADDGPWSSVVETLTRLEPVLPSTAIGVRGERLSFFTIAREVASYQTDSWMGGVPFQTLVAPRFVAATAVMEADPYLLAVEGLSEDPDEAERQEQELTAQLDESWNILFKVVVPSLTRARHNHLDNLAQFRLVRLAAWLEQQREEQGRYPDELGGLPFTIDDPWARPWPGPLHYERTADGAGYKVWSVGKDRSNDGGVGQFDLDSKDYVLQRRPPEGE
jgi:hypothetical protein